MNLSRQLKPGGYLELQDIYFPGFCHEPTQLANSRYIEFNNQLVEAGKRIGLDFQAPRKWHEWLQAAGFDDIHVQWFNWPIGPWAKTKKNKIIGQLTLTDFREGMISSIPLVSKALGRTTEEMDSLIEDTMNEFREQKLHLYQQVCFCYAKKPQKP